MEELSERINQLTESQTIAMSRLSRELAAQGHDIISLSLGEPDFNTPDFIKDAAKAAIDANYSKYPPVPGYLELREAISLKFKRDNNLDYTPDQIVVSTGAKQSIINTILCLINPGDEVLLPAPYWVSYFEMVRLAGGIPVVVPTSVENDFKISADLLRKNINPKTRMMIFSSPCNPSGSAYSYDELKALANVLEENENIITISDEIYEHINFTGPHQSLAQFEALYDRVVTVNGVSKAFAMTGWRVGYIGAPLWIANACTKMQGQFTSATCGIAQMATKAAVSADPSVTYAMKEQFQKRRDMVLEMLADIPGVKANVPDGAFYVFPDVSHYFGTSDGAHKIENASDLCMYVLHKSHVAMVTGEAFGMPNCVRLSYATSEERLRTAFSRIKDALSALS